MEKRKKPRKAKGMGQEAKNLKKHIKWNIRKKNKKTRQEKKVELEKGRERKMKVTNGKKKSYK